MGLCDSFLGERKVGISATFMADKPLPAFAHSQPHPSPKKELKSKSLSCLFIGYYSLKGEFRAYIGCIFVFVSLTAKPKV
jgi:hypothetical protein